jgi:hypothetical protein
MGGSQASSVPHGGGWQLPSCMWLHRGVFRVGQHAGHAGHADMPREGLWARSDTHVHPLGTKVAKI